MHERPHLTHIFAVTALLFGVGSTGHAEVTTYINEGDYLAALAGLSAQTVEEGFEDDTRWGEVRSTISGGQHVAPSILSQGVTWTSNNDVSNVTTSTGAAVTGDWGFYSLPHGDFSGPDHTDDVPDGFRGTTDDDMIGVGGWIQTGTPFAGISLFLDSVQVDFGDAPGGGDATVIGATPSFFGAIDADGFKTFLWQETEGAFDDQKFIFADNFTIAINASAVPEPANLALLFLASMIGIARSRRLPKGNLSSRDLLRCRGIFP